MGDGNRGGDSTTHHGDRSNRGTEGLGVATTDKSGHCVGAVW